MRLSGDADIRKKASQQQEQKIKSLGPRHAKSSTCMILNYGRHSRNRCIAVVGLAQLRSPMGREKASVANLLPPLRPPPPLAPGRLLQRGGQLFLGRAGVADQQVVKTRRQLGGVRAVGRFGLVRGVHGRRIRPAVSGVATGHHWTTTTPLPPLPPWPKMLPASDPPPPPPPPVLDAPSVPFWVVGAAPEPPVPPATEVGEETTEPPPPTAITPRPNAAALRPTPPAPPEPLAAAVLFPPTPPAPPPPPPP